MLHFRLCAPSRGALIPGIGSTIGNELAHFAIFLNAGGFEQVHVDRDIAFGGAIGCADNGILDTSAGELQITPERLEIDIVCNRCSFGQKAFPDFCAIFRLGERKIDFVVESSFECVIDCGIQICRENDDALKAFDFLEQQVDFHIGIAVIGVFDFGALGEDGIRFVKEEQCAACGRFAEAFLEVFFCFADIFGDDCGNAHAIERHAEFVGDDFGRQGFSRA